MIRFWYTLCFSVKTKGPTVDLRGGENFSPRASIVQALASPSARTMGRTLRILPSSTVTRTGPPTVQLVYVAMLIATSF
jgi:hypothetical protein